MAPRDLRIIFLGTPEFAVASLDALERAGYDIVGVVTAPDKPAGRGMKLQESAVKKYAAEKGLTILQPEKLKKEKPSIELIAIEKGKHNNLSDFNEYQKKLDTLLNHR